MDQLHQAHDNGRKVAPRPRPGTSQKHQAAQINYPQNTPGDVGDKGQGQQARCCRRRAEGDNEGNSFREACKKETRMTKPAGFAWVSADAHNWLSFPARSQQVTFTFPERKSTLSPFVPFGEIVHNIIMPDNTVRAPPAVLLPQARMAQSVRRTARTRKLRQ
jgi:hypothetical protein